jgi:hypothetical protein
MPATLAGRIQLSQSIAYQNALDNQTVNADLARIVAVELANGTGSGQANAMFSDTRSLSSGGSDNLDLAGGLTDAFGSVLTFTAIKAIIIESDAANTVDFTIGNGTNPFLGPFGAAAHTVTVRPGGLLVFVAPQTGWTVTGGTADILKILAGAANSSYRIHIIGTV